MYVHMATFCGGAWLVKSWYVCLWAGGLMGPVRMISSGHELTTDYDEKTLHELGFKDMQVTKQIHIHLWTHNTRHKTLRNVCVCGQMVFVSLGAPRRERKGEGVQLPASCLPPPQKEHIPMLLLLQEPHLTTLFDLLEMLACFKPPGPDRPQHSTEVTRAPTPQTRPRRSQTSTQSSVFPPAECSLWGAAPPRGEPVSPSVGAAHASAHVSQHAPGLPEHLRWHGQSHDPCWVFI